jgi:DNA-binding transcriptional MocR family regulator
MAEAQRLGVVVTRGRNGSYVARPQSTTSELTTQCDLSVNYPPPLDESFAQRIRQTLAVVATRDDGGALLDYPRRGWRGRPSQAGASWCSHLGFSVNEDRIVLGGGAQQALLGITALLCDPGSAIVTAGLTYPGMLAIARRTGLRVIGVEMDTEGVMPYALAAACVRVQPRFVYLVPTFQNPTTTTTSEARRRDLAHVIAQAGTQLVEDDGHAALLDHSIPPVSSFIPERSWYVTGLSKCVSPGLRTAYVATPSASEAERLSAMLVSLGQFPAPIVAQASAEVILSGLAIEVARGMRATARDRWAVARRILPQLQCGVAPTNHFGWLPVPANWRGETFSERAGAMGVRVSSAASFAVSPRFVQSAVRVCLGAASDGEALSAALSVLRAALEENSAGLPPY